MDREKRNSDPPIPENLKEVLGAAQRQALPGVEYSGWKPWFLRKRMFQAPLLVMHNSKDGRIGIMDEEGKIRIQDNINIREKDIQILNLPPKDLHYF